MHAVMKPFYNPIQIGFDPNVIQYTSPYITPLPVSKAKKTPLGTHCASGMRFKCTVCYNHLCFAFHVYIVRKMSICCRYYTKLQLGYVSCG